MRALYIGRFQLFHLGHLDVVKYIDSTSDIGSLVIAVGSSQFDHTSKSPKWPWANNPFTYTERKEMIERSIEGVIGKPHSIHPLPDYFNYPKWFKHIEDNLPRFDVLYTSDKAEREFFSTHSYEVRGFQAKYDFHAAILRERIYKGMEYRPVLTQGCLDVFDRINGEERIKELFCRDLALSLRKK